MRKKRSMISGEIAYVKRKLIEYYKLADKLEDEDSIPNLKCNYKGEIFSIGNEQSKIDLPDYQMPFEIH